VHCTYALCTAGIVLLLRLQLRSIAGGIDGVAEVLAAARGGVENESIAMQCVASCLATTSAQEEVLSKIGLGNMLGYMLTLPSDDQQTCGYLATAIQKTLKVCALFHLCNMQRARH
jgi:hypothetical protein